MKKWISKLKNRAAKFKGFSWLIKAIPIFYLVILLISYIEKGCLMDDIGNYIQVEENLILYAPISVMLGTIIGCYSFSFILILCVAAFLFDLCWRYWGILIYLFIHLIIRDNAVNMQLEYEEAVLLVKANIFITSTLLFLIAELLIRTLLYEKVDRCANRANSTK